LARAAAILVEVVILAAIMLSLLWAVRLVLFDLWLGPKYRSIATLLLVTVGCVVVVFFIAHLTAFYPG
jgi:hypothetical protein